MALSLQQTQNMLGCLRYKESKIEVHVGCMTKLCSEHDTFTFLAIKQNTIYSTANS